MPSEHALADLMDRLAIREQIDLYIDRLNHRDWSRYADLLTGALREFKEETGLTAPGPFAPLQPVRQKSGKTVHGFAFEADFDLSVFASNTFEMEWPPRSGQKKQFPEIDRIGWFGLPAAMKKIIAYQRPFLIELQEKLS